MAKNPLLSFLLLLRVIILSFFYVCNVHGASIRYDQSQFGDYNVQIHLKNIELYAILDEGILNSEYDYDYSELTEKPLTGGQHQLISNGSTATAKPPSNAVSGNVNNSNSNNNSLSSINSSAIMITNQLLATPESINATIIDEDSAIKVNRKCAPGYYRDTLGRCRRLRKPHIPFPLNV
ncbi:uncharacterized protein LOC135836514 isoform X2 [Planococcus citri]|uniref:uncharacterized protein LOC135836514 isoform X2 n=1 Tax=Planococcus citri TaxID=170843 RepID=UPI0031F94259